MAKKNQIKKKEIKSEIKMMNKLSDETRTFIKTFTIVVLCFAVMYLFVILLGNLGVFDKGYDRPEIEKGVISYDKALVGTVFNRPESTYYVVFDDFSGESGDVYLSYILSKTKVDTQIYNVDMSLGINAEYISDKSNNKAQSVSSLKINGPTLIKIVNGKNVLYLEGTDAIAAELLD